MFKITIGAPLKQYVVLIRTPNVQKEGNWRALVAEQPQSATSMQMPRTRREELRVQVLALVILCLRLDVAPKPGQYRRMLGILVEFLDLDTEPLTKLQRRLQRQAPFVRQAAQCLFHARPADGRVYPGKAQRRPKAQRAQDVKVSLVVFRVHVPDHQEIRPVVMRQLVHLAGQHRQYPLQVGVGPQRQRVAHHGEQPALEETEGHKPRKPPFDGRSPGRSELAVGGGQVETDAIEVCPA
ncbi:Uncharacterised protein [Mycobacterium tuberculosis]|nr:Uncharacterised protein [Mycobacterium tuberculosis]CNM86757.1 Uncharacterised protein [Mycobacterium tuberculosis]CNM94108.1 Uncharacterised protein [Mycobacterium tuberculosis]